MALKSGFFNSFLVNGEYDRLYTADDYSANLGAIISSGVLRDANNGFRVTASGLVLSVSAGRAWIEGRWAHLDTTYTFPTIVAPVGDMPRIDSVSLRLDTNMNARNISFIYKTGTPASSPVAPAVVRSDGIYELCLARIWVNPNATTVSVTDCRAIENLCGWVTSPIGYDEYFANLDAEFNEWFAARRTDLAVACLYKQYVWRTTLASASSAVTFDIPQYDSTGVDIIQVFVNGLLEVEGVDYTRNGSVITFGTGGGGNGMKVAGTEIVVICYKSIDGTGLGSVSDEITELQNKVAALDDFTNYNYICTGNADNVKISEIAQTFINGGSDGKILTLNVYGTLGVSAAYAGSGTETSPYQWFKLGTDAYTSRRVIVDFCNCSSVRIEAPAQSNNVLFYGTNVDVKNARFDIRSQGGFVVGFNSTAGKVYAEKCRFTIAGGSYCYLAKHGTFIDCVADCWCTGGYSQVFNAKAGSFLKIRGGEYISRAPIGYTSSCIFVTTGLTDTVVIADGVSFPVKNDTSGYEQTYGVYDLSKNGMCVYRDIVTTLNNSAVGQTINVIYSQKYDMQ